MRTYGSIISKKDLQYSRENIKERIAEFLKGKELAEAVKTSSEYSLRWFPVTLERGLAFAYALEDRSWFQEVGALSLAFETIRRKTQKALSLLDLYSPLLNSILVGNALYITQTIMQIDPLLRSEPPLETPDLEIHRPLCSALIGLQLGERARVHAARADFDRTCHMLKEDDKRYRAGVSDLIDAVITEDSVQLAEAARARSQLYLAYAQDVEDPLFDSSALFDEEGAVILTMARRRGIAVNGGVFADASFFCS